MSVPVEKSHNMFFRCYPKKESFYIDIKAKYVSAIKRNISNNPKETDASVVLYDPRKEQDSSMVLECEKFMWIKHF
jgi:hypothetical protein